MMIPSPGSNPTHYCPFFHSLVWLPLTTKNLDGQATKPSVFSKGLYPFLPRLQPHPCLNSPPWPPHPPAQVGSSEGCSRALA